MADPGSSPTVNQVLSLQLLEEDVEDFLTDAGGRDLDISPKDWHKELATRKIDYSGRIVSKATALTWKQVEPALPSIGQAAQVDAASLADGIMKEILLNPTLTIKPRAEWPKRFKRARSLVQSEQELYLIGRGLWERQMIRVVEEEDLLRDETGLKLAGGLFGVQKDGLVPGDDQLHVLHLILNLVPPNEVQNKLAGDNATLPYMGQWRNMLVTKGDCVYLSSEDMRACFFLFRLPPCWSTYFVLDEMMPGWVVDQPRKAWVHVGFTTLPMGWINAVAILQYLHRRLLAKTSSLPRHLELRRDAPVPVDRNFVSRSFLELFVDNLDGFAFGSQNARQQI